MKCFTLFTTHYSQLTKLSSIYPNIKNCHMKVTLVENENHYNEQNENIQFEDKMQFSFKFSAGHCKKNFFFFFNLFLFYFKFYF